MSAAATPVSAAAPLQWAADLGRLQLDMALQGSQALWGNTDAAARLWQDMLLAAMQMQSAMLAALCGKWVDPQAVLAAASALD